jgi:hypothetical protein
MRVYLSNYRNHWVSPYTIIEYIFFWTAWSKCGRNKGVIADTDYVDHPAWVNKWADRIEPISTAIRVLLDFIHPSINYVKIDRWDTWSMDHTLSQIILPMLKQLNKEKHGAPFVDDEDVPDELKSTNAEPKEDEWDTDSNHFKRWDYVMGEMIWAFEHLVDDTWEEEFWSGDKNDLNEDIANMFKPGWKSKRVWDREGHEKVDERIKKGLVLFGKYYRNLWD